MVVSSLPGWFCWQPGITELTFAGPLHLLPPRWRAVLLTDARKRTPLDVAYGSTVKQLIRACEEELAARMSRARHLTAAAEASSRAAAGKLGAVKAPAKARPAKKPVP